MTSADYGISKSMGHMGFDEAISKVERALGEEGFGVITEVDVQAIMKQKLGADRRPYKILGACNPKIAHNALEAEPLIGLLLPCNVVMMEEEDGTVTASIADPVELFRIVGRPDMEATMLQVRDMLRKVLDRV